MAAGTRGKGEEEDFSPHSPRDDRLPAPRDSESRSPGCRNAMTATRAEPSLNHHSGIDDGTALAEASHERRRPGTLAPAWQTQIFDVYKQAVTAIDRILRKLLAAMLSNELGDISRWLSDDDNLPAVIVGGLGYYILLRFGNDRKRRGSTMPWDIPPPLAVLWGVCWMFRGQDGESSPVLPPELWPNTKATREYYKNYDTSWEDGHSYTGHQNTLPAGGWSALPPAASPLALEGDIALLDWDGPLDYSTPVLPQQFDAWTLGEQVAGGGDLITTSLALDTVGESSFGIQSVSGDTVASLGPGARYTTSEPSISLDALSPVSAIPVSRPAGIQPKTLEGNGPLVSATAEASSPPASSGSEEQSVAADVNGPPELRCDYPGCEKTFTSADSHKKHSARHNLRFSCSMCDWRFGTRSDLERHESTVHGQGASRLFYCTDPSCRRRERGFSRRDNFRKHMREVHNQADAVRDAPSLPSSQPSSGQKRKRGDGDEVAGCVDGDGNEAGVQALERENQRLRDEVETLRREREAEEQRHRQAVAEGARELIASRETQAKLVGILDRVLSRDSS